MPGVRHGAKRGVLLVATAFLVAVGVPLVVLLQTRFLGLRALVLYGGAAVGAVALRAKIHA